MEPVSIASYRQLPTIHPLWKLLSPHIRGILAINTFGRSVLIAEGGVAHKTLSIGGKSTYGMDNFVIVIQISNNSNVNIFIDRLLETLSDLDSRIENIVKMSKLNRHENSTKYY